MLDYILLNCKYIKYWEHMSNVLLSQNFKPSMAYCARISARVQAVFVYLKTTQNNA